MPFGVTSLPNPTPHADARQASREFGGTSGQRRGGVGFKYESRNWKSRGGKVIVEGEPLTEGSVVTIVAREDDETFEVTPEEERALLEAIAQADRGQVISWEELREQLRRFG